MHDSAPECTPDEIDARITSSGASEDDDSLARLMTAALDYATRGWPVLPLHIPRSDRACSCLPDDVVVTSSNSSPRASVPRRPRRESCTTPQRQESRRPTQHQVNQEISR